MKGHNRLKHHIMSSEYGSLKSAKQESSGSSKVYGISSGNRKGSAGEFSNSKTLSKTKLLFDKSGIDKLEELKSPRNKSEERNGLVNNFMIKKSSSSSGKTRK